MKKLIYAVSVICLAAILVMALASCAKTLSDTYSSTVAGNGTQLEFNGQNVTVKYMLLYKEIASTKGTYSIEDDKITITLSSDNEDINKINGTFDFEQGEDYIKIGGITYTKVK